jgi:hypothetical protein
MSEREFEKDVSDALVEAEQFIRDLLGKKGWDSAYVDLKITGYLKTRDFDRYKKVEYENEIPEAGSGE